MGSENVHYCIKARSSESINFEIDHLMQTVPTRRVQCPQIYIKTCSTSMPSCRFLDVLSVFLVSTYMLICCGLPGVSVVYSEEVVLVGEDLVFLEIVGGTCTVSLFPVLLVAWPGVSG